MAIAVITEKPSVARDVAQALGARSRGEGHFSGNGYVVTWAIGHLVGLAEPHQIRPEWKAWRWDCLPMLPQRWPLVVLEKTKDQFAAVKRVLHDPAVQEVVCATDAGREGELIFRLVYEAAGVRKPVKRLWISSLTEDAIRDGFRKLRPAAAFDALADAAVGRSRADWLVGMNLSRAYGLSMNQPLSVGRVQTPTLAMVVERELAIRTFVPEDYLEVLATFSTEAGARYAGTWFREEKGERRRRLAPDGVDARAIVERVRKGRADVKSVKAEVKRMPPPLLYDLTELQRHSNRLYGFSAKHCLELAQGLYEKHKLLSYPRTSSRHLSSEIAATLPDVVRAIREPYLGQLAPGTGERPLGARFVDDAKVTDHHALIPTTTAPNLARLTPDECKLYDLVCRRLLSAWHGDFVWEATAVVTQVTSSAVDLFASSGTAVRERGWKVLDAGRPGKPPGAGEDDQELPLLRAAQPVRVEDVKPVAKKTQPPRRFTDATLLTAMETAGKTIDEAELSEAMRETGLGTPATRAAIIETLLTRQYVVRNGKTLEATQRGIDLISAVDPIVKSPEMTGQWEARLQRVERKQGELAPFLAGIEQYVRDVISRMPPPRGGTRNDPRQGTLFALPEAPAKTSGANGHRAGASTSPARGSANGPAPAAASAARGSGNGHAAGLSSAASAANSSANGRARSSSGAGSVASGSTNGHSPAISSAGSAASGSGQAPTTFGAASTARGSAHGQAPSSSGPASTARGSANGHGTAPYGSGQSSPVPRVDDHAQLKSPVPRPSAPTERTRPALSSATIPPPAPRNEHVPRTPVAADDLLGLLRSAFGFESFRPHQEAVCKAATLGQDLLLVMPTGAGKSLCYQLPGIARGGTTLVVSPLIALMEDQVAKMRASGFRAERIHSGRDRAESRQVAADYLEGRLDFLFIAPERLGVPGFIEHLAKRRPSLIAIDEAHCISQWGHDFRPDYRLLGQRLPLLRPAPVIALTATATPIVQKDIIDQLGLGSGQAFIHGFRRDNLAVEVIEVKTNQRPERTIQLLKDGKRRPAIVYAPSRKVAEAVAEELSAHFPVEAYHAGLGAKVRDSIQARFLGGELDVIVATIAFGMGVDKADIRTVIHLALPGSVEGYYQEIGRAGRDGKPSRAVLMHSYADRRTHEFFHERDYPEPDDLDRVFKALTAKPIPREEVLDSMRMDSETFEKALDKLWVHGGVLVSPDDELSRGSGDWKAPYIAQRARRLEQLDQMARFAESAGCRMLHLVNHFGDREDPGTPCGHCDICAPGACAVTEFRPLSTAELNAARATLFALDEADGQGTGRLCKLCVGETPQDRRVFDGILAALIRAGFVRTQADAFEKDGKTINFLRAWLTDEGRENPDLSRLTMTGSPGGNEPKRRSSKKGRGGRSRTSGGGGPVSASVVAALKEWRLMEARRRKIPAFRILTDKVLTELAQTRPTSEAELLEVHGIGPKIAETYGAKLISLCRS